MASLWGRLQWVWVCVEQGKAACTFPPPLVLAQGHTHMPVRVGGFTFRRQHRLPARAAWQPQPPHPCLGYFSVCLV